MGYEVLLLCFSFTVPSTTRSLLLDHIVRDIESIQSPLANILIGFAFSQEMSTGAVNYALIPNKEGILSIALLELFRMPRIALHCPCHESSSLFFFTKWVVGITLLQIGLKRLSMRVPLDLLHEFTTACGNPHTLKSMSMFSCCVNKSTNCSLPTGRPVLTWSASTFSSASLSLSERSTDTLVLSKPSKKSLSISWTLELDGCSVETGRPVLTIEFVVFGWVWVCWEFLPCPATSYPNSCIQ